MLALALLFVVQVSEPVTVRSTARYSAVRDSLEAAELRFFSQWGTAFRASLLKAEYWESVRGVMHSCPWPGVTSVDSAQRDRAHMIGTEPAVGRCPVWLLDSFPKERDEAGGVDNALASRFQTAVRADRARLIDRFDSAAIRFPDDNWIVGQRVRLLIDQQQGEAALKASTLCSTSSWWCWAMQGYARYHLRQYREADDAYRHAARLMPQSVLCDWVDIAPLLPPTERREYRAEGCEFRIGLAQNVWWLSDPLWTDSVNERRVEHFARMTNVQLRRALDHDERWSWAVEAGGGALSEMVLRYGWPNYLHWGGERNDGAQVGRVLLVGGRPNSPYTTFEYAEPRLHFVPSLRAIRNPLSSVLSDWSLASPAQEEPRPYAAATSRALPLDVSEFIAREWWPSEHAPFHAGLRALGMPATVFLRRQHAAIIGVASEATATFSRAILTWSDRPERAIGLDTARVIRAGHVGLAAEIAAAPALIDVTVEGRGAQAVGRARYAIAPPRPLSEMAAGEKAISDIILLSPDEISIDTSATLPLLRAMQLSQSEISTRSVRLYWETYGYRPSDTLDVAIAVRRIDEPTALRRLAITFQLASDPSNPIAISWRRPYAEPGTSAGSGGVPVIPHTVLVNLERLGAGEYEIMVVVRKPGETEVTSRRDIRRVLP